MPPSDPVNLIRDEHRRLLPHLAHLDDAAAEMATAADDEVRKRLATLSGFLRDHLLEHAEAEERDLYPVVERLLRELGGATETMSRDHMAITGKVEELERLSHAVHDRSINDADRAAATRLLYGLTALLENHFAKEEDVYLPLLERGLNPQEIEELARRLESHP